LRFGATALAGVQGVDLRQLVSVELEVEDVEVLSDAVRFGRLGNDLAALQVPAEHDLGRALRVSLGDPGDGGVLQRAGVFTFPVEGDSTDG